MGKKKKKPEKSGLEIIESVVNILVGITNIGYMIYSLFKG